jgi:hypothetical protein
MITGLFEQDRCFLWINIRKGSGMEQSPSQPPFISSPATRLRNGGLPGTCQGAGRASAARNEPEYLLGLFPGLQTLRYRRLKMVLVSPQVLFSELSNGIRKN